ncbi:ABC transporter permease [Martelella alba]|uniref:ABC transporter permease n=1 Tax=Martelella alba TaxID=2590451 RepID=A0A506U5E2_9HYPH|nr:ABC transporter permease [Martelella alba]TPW29070.1 ABC transporter permease [Martelella alba]
MMSKLKQISAMVKVNLLSLPRRFPLAISMALSVTLVVCTLTGFLSMAAGFENALNVTGSPSVAVILGGGTNQENGSDIPADVIRTIEAMSNHLEVQRDAAGNLVMSREIVVPVDMRQDGANSAKVLALRGMDPAGLSLRDGIALTAGRLPASGSREIVVGDRIASEFTTLAIGSKVRLGAVDWTVVGHFSAHGSAFESELWADLDAVRSTFDKQGQVQSLRLRLINGDGITKLKTALDGITATPLVILSEADLYAGQSSRTANLIRLFGWPLALLMALGATAGAFTTMMSSVSDRTVEIATVRALGFSRLSAFVATWVEAIVLAAAGVTIGLAASWLLFNGWRASTIGANNVNMAFQLAVNAHVMLTAGLLGLAIGMIGGLIPAFSATRLPLVKALRARA